ncbi:bifunctional UDP-N-acetylglucosamine diphosphorylase/glucosamine-1-phosphate N-acetyltransferase GlmU [Sulfoacidibacillus thermotolerans]|uniref:Bifunctional protein GlmU n=1 Tax=Sulfoacidibacillus thermotolerans TaxID=1765684 RepID=A0A2U3DB12_SULT2|nr:bifunctional UDP-N-acetylglucosamine diphosphorylase/glucosamine-1-phosphate N-acetyltransferase GlmU [Sulfoacidibacillus thermotolerans]PWI58442.1 UDP-N-acetylglucosamine diphosphorylase/glucosamine-1-phosphate N-acetyltransferase [Sulfoacidibacillus thermotolerans]
MKKIGVVLAAGLGKRMNSKRHKVVHSVCGKPMIAHIVEQMEAVGFDRLFVVVGRLEEQVREVLQDRVTYVQQREQLGTGHAVQQVAPYLDPDSITVVLYGDCPLLRHEEIERLIGEAETSHATTVLTAKVEDPYAYGRIIRDEQGDVVRIVEEKDATDDEKKVQEVNSGIYAFQTPDLLMALRELTANNAQGEYLLTDCIQHIRAHQGTVRPVVVSDPDDIANVNDRVQLAAVEARMRRRLLLRHMQNGVTIIDPATTYIGADVYIGRDTTLLPGCIVEGNTYIGEDCMIGPNVRLVDAKIADAVHITSSVILQSEVQESASIGPFAYIRPGSQIGPGVKVGDFVEIKNSILGSGTKVSHLAYVGDSEIGERVNVGCGVVTVNYDGYQKHKTMIGNDSFIGSNVNLIAPLMLGEGVYVATGSTITDDLAQDDFAIARERQTTKKGYARGLRMKLQQKSAD